MDWDSLTQALFPAPYPSTIEESPNKSWSSHPLLESLVWLPWVGPFTEHLLRLFSMKSKLPSEGLTLGSELRRLQLLFVRMSVLYQFLNLKCMHVFPLQVPSPRYLSDINFLISCFEPSTWLVAVKVLRNISIHAILDLINASNSQPALMVRELV